MAVALVPDQAIFEYICFSEIGTRFMDERHECTRWCKNYRQADGWFNL